MGADIMVLAADPNGPEPVGDLVVRGGAPLRGVRIGGARTADLIDELPMLAVVMAAAGGPSEVRDAGELRVKESDRVALVVRGLRAIGVDVEELPDGWDADIPKWKVGDKDLATRAASGSVNAPATHAAAISPWECPNTASGTTPTEAHTAASDTITAKDTGCSTSTRSSPGAPGS